MAGDARERPSLKEEGAQIFVGHGGPTTSMTRRKRSNVPLVLLLVLVAIATAFLLWHASR